jgi:hypothetical protein
MSNLNVTIHTIAGTFVVPADKQADLILWLQHNAIKIGAEAVKEQSQNSNRNYPGRQLINESI